MLLSLCVCLFLLQTPKLLSNGGFEGSYSSTASDTTAGNKDIGEVASGWADNSAWADVKARYSCERVNPHSGHTCQRIDVLQVNRGSLEFGQSSFLEDGYYQASLWLRAKEPTQIQVKLQPDTPPYEAYWLKDITVTPVWTKVTLSGYVSQRGNASLLVVAGRPATIWVDDASLHAGGMLDFRFWRWEWTSFTQRLTEQLRTHFDKPPPAGVPSRKWLLTFDDEFKEQSLDHAKWSASAGADKNPENPLQYFLPSEVSVGKGHLSIDTHRRRYGGCSFTSGEISTVDKFSQQYGRFEARCRFPKTAGAWSAFYLLPASKVWPPEIDIAEVIGRNPHTVYLTSHWLDVDDNHKKESSQWSADTWNASDWHTYAVEWEPGSVQWYVDGVLKATTSNAVPQLPMYVRLNTAVGGSFGGEPDTKGWPQTFDVDYVRVYRQANDPEPIYGPLSHLPQQVLLTYWPVEVMLVGILLNWTRLRRLGNYKFGTGLLAIAVTVSAVDYTVFRFQIINWDDWYIALPLLIAELFGIVHVLGLQYTLWPRVPLPLKTLEYADQRPIYIMIPTVNEGCSILEPTVAGALAARTAYLQVYPDTQVEIILCNDGLVVNANRWQDVEVLAEQMGIQCMTRKDGGGAKAGNIEFCRQMLGGTGNALLVIFDADQIATPNFLLQTVPLFADPSIGWVQTGQYYRNLDNPVARWANDQQALFYEVLCPAKALQNSAFMCGTNLVIRAACLDEIGGLPQDSVTEDFAASILLHSRWRSLFLTDVLATGLGPIDLRSYFSQQRRWAIGTLGVLRRHWKGIFLPWHGHLSLAQRVQYGLACTHYLCGLRDLVFLIAPLAYIFYGLSAIQGVDLPTFLIHFLPYLFLSQLAFWRIFRQKTGLRGILIGFGCFPVLIESLLTMLTNIHISFSVTAKRRARKPSRLVLLPHALCAAACASGLGLAIREGLTSELLAMSAFWIAYTLVMLCGVLWLGITDSLAWNKAEQNRTNEAEQNRTDDAPAFFGLPVEGHSAAETDPMS